MNLSARPAKTAVFRYLKNYLRNSKGKVCVDAACGNMKNRKLFPSALYYGIDLREEVVRHGLKKIKSGIGIIADLTNIEMPYGSVDFLVSTNTLFWMDSKTQMDTIAKMANWVRQDGTVFLDVRNNADIETIIELMNNKFMKVKIIYYRNFVSQWFDRFLDKKGHIKRRQFAKSRFILLISFVLSLFESFTNRKRSWNKDAIIVCFNRKEMVPDNELSMKAFSKTDHPRMYDARTNSSDTGRYVHFKREIDTGSVKSFFVDRAKKHNPLCPEVTMLYQDHAPDLAKKRDQEEKKILLSLMKPLDSDAVLDVGCGIGRWAEVLSQKVRLYHGTDMMSELVEIARKRHEGLGNVSFQVVSAEEIVDGDSHKLPELSFNIVIVAGVLHYVNDASLEKILKGVSKYSATKSRLVIRGPFAIDKRLTLDRIWSSELNAEYSAVYRTRKEFAGLLKYILPNHQLIVDQPLYDAKLNNRQETMQHVFMLEKK